MGWVKPAAWPQPFYSGSRMHHLSRSSTRATCATSARLTQVCCTQPSLGASLGPSSRWQAQGPPAGLPSGAQCYVGAAVPHHNGTASTCSGRCPHTHLHHDQHEWPPHSTGIHPSTSNPALSHAERCIAQRPGQCRTIRQGPHVRSAPSAAVALRPASAA